MLKRIKPTLEQHLQAAMHSLTLLCRKPLATLMTVIVIAIALALPALFGVLTGNVSRLTASWGRSSHMSLYLQLGMNQAEQQQLLQKVSDTQGVGKATLRSSEEGLKELTQQEGMHDIMRYLPENPLPAVIEVVPSLTVDTPAKIEALFLELKRIPEVNQAKLDMEWITRFHAILGFLSKASEGSMALLAMAVVFIIGTKLRLAIQNRQEEIQILKLIGATDAYIRRPFLYSGVLYGLAGALVAIFLVNILILALGIAMKPLVTAYQIHYPLTGLSMRQILQLLSFAFILGMLGAGLSVRRQLASIEPYN